MCKTFITKGVIVLRFIRVIFCTFVILLLFGITSVFAEEKIGISDETTNIDAVVFINEQTAVTDTVLIEMSKALDGLSTTHKLLCVDSEGYLAFENQNQEINKLFYVDFSPIAIADGMTISIIYDDCSGLARYYVNRKAAYFVSDLSELEAQVRVKSDFFTLKTDSDSIYIGDVFSSVSIENDNGGGSAKLIALQEHLYENHIRLIAGLDTVFASEVGFELKIYENNKLINEVILSSNTVYTDILADYDEVYAQSYGYKYFSALEISDVYIDGGNYYIIARPYAEICGALRFGDPVGIIAERERLLFDEGFKTVALEGYGSALAALSCDGEIYATVSTPEAAVVDVYIDDVKVSSIEIEQGRSSVYLASVDGGVHNLRLESNNGDGVRFLSLSYKENHKELSCAHSFANDSDWKMVSGGFEVLCENCGKYILFNETEAPAFLLTFEEGVSKEASQYIGYSVVSPNSFNIGNDIDGDKALVAGTDKYHIDVEQSVLADMPYYTVSFDLRITERGESGANISVLTLVSNYRNGKKISGYSADFAYFFKYNPQSKTISTIDIDWDESLLNDKNSTAININESFKVTIAVDTKNCMARVFVNEKYIGISEKLLVDVMGDGKVYPCFRFNDGGGCYPVYDNFKISELKVK